VHWLARPGCCLLFISAINLVGGKPGIAQVQPEIEQTGTTNLQMPFDPDDANDSEFLKHLLLSHGLSLTLKDNGTLGLDEYLEISQFKSEQGITNQRLLQDVSENLVLSVFSEEPQFTDELPITTSNADDWRIVWWQLNDRATSQESVKQAFQLSETARLNTPKRERLPLFTSNNQQTFQQLSQQLNQSGFDVEFGEECDIESGVRQAVDQWIERGEFPRRNNLFPRSKLASIDVYSEGVSKRWKVIWIECASGIKMLKIPDSKNQAPVPQPSKQEQPAPKAQPLITQQPAPTAQPTLKEQPATPPPLAAAQTSSPQLPPTTKPVSPIDSKPNNSSGDVLTMNDDVPPGFEALSEPQYVYVDVYFNDNLIGATGIISTPEDITFDDPEEVARLLQESVTSTELVNWLSGPLPTNGHLACFGPNDPEGCGVVPADPLAVIYDAASLRLDVFIHQGLQSIAARAVQRHLPSPPAAYTAILSTYAIVSKLDGEQTGVDLSGRGLFSYGRGNISAHADYNNRQERSRLRELKLSHYFNDYELTAGTYAMHSGGSLTDINLIGVGFSSSFKTRVDLEHAFSSQLVVYLPRRSIVQLLVDGRVYAGDSYEAGNQALDTGPLPDGTYEIEINIIDPTTGTRSERRIFTKSTQIPPRGETIISVGAGLARDGQSDSTTPKASSLGVLGASVTRRLTDQSALRLGMLQYQNDSFFQSGWTYLGPALSLQATASVGESNLKAASVQAAASIKNTTLGMGLRHFSSSKTPSVGSIESEFFLPDFSQASFTASHTFERFSLGAQSSIRLEKDASGNTVPEHSHSLFAQKPLFRKRYQRGVLTSRYQYTTTERRADLGIKIYLGKGDFDTNLGLRGIRPDDGPHTWQLDLAANWQPTINGLGNMQNGVYLSKSPSQSSRGVRLELAHPTFKASAATDLSESGGNEVKNSIASISAHFGLDNQGAGMGGSDFSQSGVVIDVNGSPQNAKFDIVVNNAKVSVGSIGRQQFIGLQPFNHYELKLVPHTLLGNGLDSQVHSFTLFPGTVKRINIDAKRQVLLIAMITDENGDTVFDAVAKTDSNTLIIRDDGILQAEVLEGEVLNIRKKDGSQCSLAVPDLLLEDVVIPDDPLVCVSKQSIGSINTDSSRPVKADTATDKNNSPIGS